MGSRIRRGDQVQVITGADRGKQGRVISVDLEKGVARVEKARMQKRHFKPGRKSARAGGIIDQEGSIALSNIMLVDSETGKPSRVRIQREDGRRIRVFAKSGQPVPDPNS